jgi:hypothetical protein
MPPPPKPKTTKASRPSTGGRERVEREDSSSGPNPRAPRSQSSSGRMTKADVLQEQLARMYMMLGTMVMPFGRFYPVLGPVGENLRNLSAEAAEAWMELGAKDKRVLEMLESIVGASTWGNVIGIHLAIFASALPGGGYIQHVTAESAIDDEIIKQGKAMGMSDAEIAEAIQRMRTPTGAPEGMPAREMDVGGPGDTVRVQEPVSATRSGIVSPQELGVTQAGEDHTFPTDASPPNGRG